MKLANHLAAACLAVCASTTIATTAAQAVGQPFLIMEDGLTGSILDFFDFGAPSGVKETRLTGTVTSEVGAAGTVGKDFMFQSSLFGASTLTFDGVSINVEDVGPSGTFDPVQSPGMFTFEMLAYLPIATDMPDPMSPGDFIFTYDAPFDFYDGYSSDFPEHILELTVYFDGDYPTKTFEEIFMGSVVDMYDYVEGPLNVTKMTLGVQGGPPVPQVPVPASGLMLLTGFAALTLRRKRG